MVLAVSHALDPKFGTNYLTLPDTVVSKPAVSHTSGNSTVEILTHTCPSFHNCLFF